MKWFCFLLFLCYFVSLKAQSSEQLLGQANALASKDPAQAAAHFDSLRSRGLVSADLFLAQGNAYLATEDWGRAVLAYERGLRLHPGHPLLSNNLQFVETQLETVLTDLPSFFIQRWWKWAGSRLGARSAYILAVVLWWLSIGAFGFWYFKRQELSEKKRFLLLPLASLSVILAIFFYSLNQSRIAELNRKDQAVLVSPSAPLRVAPGAEATLEQTLTAGQRLKIIDVFQQKYYKVSLRDGKQGWLSKDDLEII